MWPFVAALQPEGKSVETKSSETYDTLCADLVMAIVSVNKWSLRKTFSIFFSLESEGLTDFRRVRRWTPESIRLRLVRAGYKRGEFLENLVANRLLAASVELTEDKLGALLAASASRDVSQIHTILESVPGIGPVVIEKFISLSKKGQ